MPSVSRQKLKLEIYVKIPRALCTSFYRAIYVSDLGQEIYIYIISFNPNSFMKVKSLSCVRLFAVPWTAAHQAPPPMGFSRQEYWSGLSFPSPGDLPNPGIKPRSPALQADALTSEPPGKPNIYNDSIQMNSHSEVMCWAPVRTSVDLFGGHNL